MQTWIITSFILGIISNLHCFGMCGPIAFALPLNRTSKAVLFRGILEYHIGRILVYTTLGYIVGFIGFGIKMIGLLQIVSIFAGIFVILYAWRNTSFIQKIIPEISASFNFLPNNIMGIFIRSNSKFKLFGLGLLNGLLPCGMVYTALISSILTGTPYSSGISMLSFGLGTLPGMIAMSYFTSRLSLSYKSKINRYLPYIITVIGMLLILRGLNLNIPYISPRATILESKKEMKFECCEVKYCKIEKRSLQINNK